MGFVPLRRSHHFHFSSSSSSLVPSLLHAPDMSAAFRPPEGTPPPIIGKAGNYTVFITPPLTPSPSESPRTPKTPIFTVDLTPKSKISSYSSPDLNSEKVAESAVPKTPPSPPTPPVQVPPHQFEKVNNVKLKKKNGGGEEEEEEGPFSFFWNAVAKVQDAHSNLDQYLADWFGLNQSKYQWALNDYYEAQGMEDKQGGIGKPNKVVRMETV